MEKKIYDYWLCSIPGVGNRSIHKLLALWGSARDIYHASEKELAGVLTESRLEELKKLRAQWDLRGEWQKMEEQGIRFLTVEDEDYPGRLREIPDAPWGIFYRGSLPADTRPSVALIGARDCSEYGAYVAGELGTFLGKCGVQVISGMARGIDGIGQQAALQAGGFTTAVLGSGVDVCYPSQNRRLYEQILKRGCILSSYPPGTLPRPQNFPPRNRIVSGLADVVVVVEARDKSGTLITVDMALEQGREVYVVPGRITDRLSDSCNRLLKQGAGVLLSPEEFLTELQELWACRRNTEVESHSKRPGQPLLRETVRGLGKHPNPMEDDQSSAPERLSPQLRELYRLLDFTPKCAEDFLEKLPEKREISQVNAGLMRLCLMELACQESPGYFCKRGRK